MRAQCEGSAGRAGSHSCFSLAPCLQSDPFERSALSRRGVALVGNGMARELPRVPSTHALGSSSNDPPLLRVGSCTYKLDDDRSGIPAAVARKLMLEQRANAGHERLPSPRTFTSRRSLPTLPTSPEKTSICLQQTSGLLPAHLSGEDMSSVGLWSSPQHSAVLRSPSSVRALLSTRKSCPLPFDASEHERLRKLAEEAADRAISSAERARVQADKDAQQRIATNRALMHERSHREKEDRLKACNSERFVDRREELAHLAAKKSGFSIANGAHNGWGDGRTGATAQVGRQGGAILSAAQGVCNMAHADSELRNNGHGRGAGALLDARGSGNCPGAEGSPGGGRRNTRRDGATEDRSFGSRGGRGMNTTISYSGAINGNPGADLGAGDGESGAENAIGRPNASASCGTGEQDLSANHALGHGPEGALGLKWKLVGISQPKNGIELSNGALSGALQTKLEQAQARAPTAGSHSRFEFEFTKGEFQSFKVTDLCPDSFVRVGDNCFQPVWGAVTRLSRKGAASPHDARYRIGPGARGPRDRGPSPGKGSARSDNWDGTEGDDQEDSAGANERALTIDWSLITKALPCGSDAESADKRKAMFAKWDVNGNGCLSFTEVDSAMRELMGEVTAILLKAAAHQWNNSWKMVIMRAFTHAKQSNKKLKGKKKRKDDYVEFDEFRLLLLCMRQYFELYVGFSRLDSNMDRRLDYGEFVAGLPRLATWGIQLSEADAEAEFAKIDDNGGGYILFDEFIVWAIEKKFDLDDDDDFDDFDDLAGELF